jgi:hypothetical protein
MEELNAGRNVDGREQRECAFVRQDRESETRYSDLSALLQAIDFDLTRGKGVQSRTSAGHPCRGRLRGLSQARVQPVLECRLTNFAKIPASGPALKHAGHSQRNNSGASVNLH